MVGHRVVEVTGSRKNPMSDIKTWQNVIKYKVVHINHNTNIKWKTQPKMENDGTSKAGIEGKTDGGCGTPHSKNITSFHI